MNTSYRPEDLQTVERGLLIDGEEVPAKSGKTFERFSPAHNRLVGRFPTAGADDADRAIRAASRAFNGPWSQTSGAERADILHSVASLIRDRQEELALLETADTGKPIQQARGEIADSAGLWEYAATLARQNYGDAHNHLGLDTLAMVVREPAGVIAMITPWNFPFLIASQKLPFALAAGNTAVVKPSEFSSSTTLLLGDFLAQAGLPRGVVNIVTGAGETGQAIAEHPLTAMVSFTGSTRVGKLLAATAGNDLKRVELELGGKNPQIVFADADLDAAVDAAVFGGYFNVGQCCNSGSRLIVERGIAHEFAQRVAERSAHVKVGDPLLAETNVGPIISAQQRRTIQQYVDQGRADGAKVVLGGEAYDAFDGLYFEPTIFSQVEASMSIAQEEIFGPVVSVLAFDTPEEAVTLANGTEYGLSAGVWSNNVNNALPVARDLRAGTIWVNRWMNGYPEVPFGGFGQSGIGRELGRQALDAFSETKTIQLQVGPRTTRWVTAHDDDA